MVPIPPKSSPSLSLFLSCKVDTAEKGIPSSNLNALSPLKPFLVLKTPWLKAEARCSSYRKKYFVESENWNRVIHDLWHCLSTQELDSMVLVGFFQFRIFFGSMMQFALSIAQPAANSLMHHNIRPHQLLAGNAFCWSELTDALEDSNLFPISVIYAA